MTQIRHLALASVMALCALSPAAWTADKVDAAQLKKNKELVLGLTEAMADKDVDKAASYLADGYVQHNPNVPTGKAGFVGFFGPRWAGQKTEAHPLDNPPVEIVAQGDLVMLIFKKATPDPVDPNSSYDLFSFDAYRVTNGKISEHWDGYPKRAAAAPTSQK